MTYDAAFSGNKGKVKHTINGVSNKFKRMCELYRTFSKDWEHLYIFNDDMIVELYNHESYGTFVSNNNGFALGKKWLNVNVSMWLEDIERGLLFKQELYNDGKFPHWWLDNIFKDRSWKTVRNQQNKNC